VKSWVLLKPASGANVTVMGTFRGGTTAFVHGTGFNRVEEAYLVVTMIYARLNDSGHMVTSEIDFTSKVSEKHVRSRDETYTNILYTGRITVFLLEQIRQTDTNTLTVTHRHPVRPW